MKRLFLYILVALMATLVTAPSTSWAQQNEDESTFETIAPNSGLIAINVPVEGVEPFKLASEENEQSAFWLGVHQTIAEPGVLTTEDCPFADSNVSAECSTRTDVQQTFTTEIEQYWLLPEGSEQGPGHVMLTGSMMTVKVDDREIVLESGEEDHSYLLIISGGDGDLQTARDLNTRMKISNFVGGATMITSLPPGQFVSLNYVEQNIQAALSGECGNDGCNYVTLVTVDINGAVSVASFAKVDGIFMPMVLVASNWYEEEAQS